MGVCGIFRPPVQGGSNELISKFLSSMILYNHSSYFKSGEINSCRLSPLPSTTLSTPEGHWLTCALGCVKKHFFVRINLKLPENCPWVWTTNTLKYQ